MLPSPFWPVRAGDRKEAERPPPDSRSQPRTAPLPQCGHTDGATAARNRFVAAPNEHHGAGSRVPAPALTHSLYPRAARSRATGRPENVRTRAGLARTRRVRRPGTRAAGFAARRRAARARRLMRPARRTELGGGLLAERGPPGPLPATRGDLRPQGTRLCRVRTGTMRPSPSRGPVSQPVPQARPHSMGATVRLKPSLRPRPAAPGRQGV
jgi:hypothetical protein